jgi:hypothetical protein
MGLRRAGRRDVHVRDGNVLTQLLTESTQKSADVGTSEREEDVLSQRTQVHAGTGRQNRKPDANSRDYWCTDANGWLFGTISATACAWAFSPRKALITAA